MQTDGPGMPTAKFAIIKWSYKDNGFVSCLLTCCEYLYAACVDLTRSIKKSKCLGTQLLS